MDYKVFLETIRQALQERLPKDLQLIIRPVPKNNGILLDGLSIQSPDSCLAPTVYLNPYYTLYQEGMSIDAICSDILGLFQNNLSPGFASDNALNNFENVKSRIMMRLIHTDSNLELLEEVPYIPYLDLSIVFYLFLERSSSGQMTTLIHNEFLSHWQVDAQELLHLALRNTPAEYPPELRSMSEVMKDIARQNMGDDYDEEYLSQLLEDDEHFSPLYVLSNHAGIYGACCMLYHNTLKNFADNLEKDLIIIPSSIHEVLLTPDNGEMSYDYLNSMVTSINHSEVPAEDQLSDHIYLYTRADDRIRIIHG
ncbi:MAG: hypothetical protein HFG55_03000 [Lachnospiraceae bacterium]|nr:hypothetical protein [Lachnospiraceae bacterium]